jgi:hypothetical protein
MIDAVAGAEVILHSLRGRSGKQNHTKLFEELGTDIGVALLTLPEIQEAVEEKPTGFGERADEYRYYVIFLIDPLGPADAAEEIEVRESVCAQPRMTQEGVSPSVRN